MQLREASVTGPRMARIDGRALEAVRTAVWHHLLAPALDTGGEAPSPAAVRAAREAVALLERLGWPGDPVAPAPMVEEEDVRLVMRAGRACLLCGEDLARDLVALPPGTDGRSRAEQARRELARGRQVVTCLDRGRRAAQAPAGREGSASR